MSIRELRFRWCYFWDTFKKVVSNGAIFRNDPLYWNLLVNGEIVEEYNGNFWQFVKWIVTHKTFDDL